MNGAWFEADQLSNPNVVTTDEEVATCKLRRKSAVKVSDVPTPEDDEVIAAMVRRYKG